MRALIALSLLFTLCLAGDRWSIKLEKGKDPRVFALEHNVKYITSVMDYSIFESTRMTPTVFYATPGLHKDTKSKKFKRYASRTSDPLFPQQWHLHTLGIDQIPDGNATGQGVTVAIVDDGLEYDHPDLQDNFDARNSWDFNYNQPNVTPFHRDGHGTCAAGVCCAARNNICGRGVAYNAKVAGIRLIARDTYDYQEAQGLSHKHDKIDIYSCSWGPQDSGRHMAAPGRVTRDVLKTTGSIYVWAGGNGRESQDNGNYDGYANSPYTLTIGAVDHLNNQAWYSEPCACLLAVAPSSGSGVGVTTTDLKGNWGYSRGECTNQFGGTSSAAPLAAGIFALMLEINHNLTSRDIMHIVAQTSKTGHTHEKGFGVLEIPPLLVATRSHQLVPKQIKVKSGIVSINQPIPDDGTWLKHTIHTEHTLQFIEQIAVTVHMVHARHGQVLVELGNSRLAEHRGDEHGGSSIWTYTTLHEWGKRDKDWEFRIRDDTHDRFTGSLISVSLTFFGY